MHPSTRTSGDGKSESSVLFAIRKIGSVFARGWLKFLAIFSVYLVVVVGAVWLVKSVLPPIMVSQLGLISAHGKLTRAGTFLVVAESIALVTVAVLFVAIAAFGSATVVSARLLSASHVRLLSAIARGFRRAPVTLLASALAYGSVVLLFILAPLVTVFGVLGLAAHFWVRRWRRWPSLRTVVTLAVPFGAATVVLVRWSLLLPAASLESGGPRRILSRSSAAARGQSVFVAIVWVASIAVVAGAYLGVDALIGALWPNVAWASPVAGLVALSMVSLPIVAATTLYERNGGQIDPDDHAPGSGSVKVLPRSRRAVAQLAVVSMFVGFVLSQGPVFSAPAFADTTVVSTTSVTGQFPTAPTTADHVSLTIRVGTSSVAPTGTVIVAEGASQLAANDVHGVSGHAYSTVTLNVGAFAAGSHTMTVSYSGDAQVSPSSTTYAFSVVPVGATVTISTPNNTNPDATHTATIGENVEVDVDVTGDTVPTGMVTLYTQDDGSAVPPVAYGSPVALASGHATFTLTNIQAGALLLTAHYGGDGSFVAQDASGEFRLTVAATSALSVATSASTVTYGVPFTLTATVTSGLAQATGTVVFHGLGADSPAVTVGSGGIATWVPPSGDVFPVVSPYSVTASYSGDELHQPATSSAISEAVTAASTATTVTVSPTGTTAYGTELTLGAEVTSSAVFGSTSACTSSPATCERGHVQFGDDLGNIGSPVELAADGTASLLHVVRPAGSHPIVAFYLPAEGFAESTSSPVTALVTATLVTISLIANPASVVPNQDTVLTATVTDTSPGATGIPAGTVTFRDGSTIVGTGLVGGSVVTATLTTHFSAAGTHDFTASYDGGTNVATPTPASADVVVTLPVPTLTITTNPLAPKAGQSITYTVHVDLAGSWAQPDPTGNVTLSSGGTALGSSALVYVSPGQAIATFTASSGFATGDRSLEASYEGDFEVAPATLTQASTVLPNPTTVSIQSVDPAPTYGSLMTISVAVGHSGSSLVPSGSVVVRDGPAGTTLGTLTLAGDVASGSIHSPGRGAHTLYAFYNGDNYFAEGGPSAGQAITVGAGTPVVTITRPSNSQPYSTDVETEQVIWATVLGQDGVTPATGTVTFTGRNNATIATAILDASGTARVPSIWLAAGASYDLRATFGGDANFGSANSTPYQVSVSSVTPQIALGNRAIHPGASTLTLSAIVGIPYAYPVSGTVTFLMDGLPIAVAGNPVSRIPPTDPPTTAAVYQLTFPLPSVGPHTYRAVFNGDDSYNAVTSSDFTLTAVVPDRVVIAQSPPTPVAQVGMPLSFGIHAVSVASTPPVGVLSYYDVTGGLPGTLFGTETLTSLSGGAGIFSTSSLSGGSHTIRVVFSPSDPQFSDAEVTFTVTVLKYASFAQITRPSTAAAGSPTAVTVDVVAATTSAPIPSGGTLSISGGLTTCTPVAGAHATCLITWPLGGPGDIHVSWTGDANFDSVTSTAATTITAATSQVTATASPASGWNVGVPITLSWAVTTAFGAATNGGISVRVGARNFCTTTPPARATGSCQGIFRPGESGPIVLEYAGATNIAASSSSISGAVGACSQLVLSVNAAASSLTATPPTNCVLPGNLRGYLQGTVVSVAATPPTGLTLESWTKMEPPGSTAITLAPTSPTVVTFGVNDIEIDATFIGQCFRVVLYVAGPLEANPPGTINANAPNCDSQPTTWQPAPLDSTFPRGSKVGWFLVGTAIDVTAVGGNNAADHSVAPTRYDLYSWCQGATVDAVNGIDACTYETAFTPPSATRSSPDPAVISTFHHTVTVGENLAVGAVFGPVCYPLDATVTGGGTVTADIPPNCNKPGAAPGYSINTHVTQRATSATPYSYANWDASPHLATAPGSTVANPQYLNTVAAATRMVTIHPGNNTAVTSFVTCRALTVTVEGSAYTNYPNTVSTAEPTTTRGTGYLAPNCAVDPNIAQLYAPNTTIELRPITNNPAQTESNKQQIREVLGWTGAGTTNAPMADKVVSDRPCATKLETCVGDRIVQLGNADQAVTLQLYRPAACSPITLATEPFGNADPTLEASSTTKSGDLTTCPSGTYLTSDTPEFGSFNEVTIRVTPPPGFHGLVSWATEIALDDAASQGTVTHLQLDGTACSTARTAFPSVLQGQGVAGSRTPNAFANQFCTAAAGAHNRDDYLLRTPANGPVRATAYLCEGIHTSVTLLNPLKQTRQLLPTDVSDSFSGFPSPSCPHLESQHAFPIGSTITVSPAAPPAGFTFRGWSALPAGAVEQADHSVRVPLDGSAAFATLSAIYEITCYRLTLDTANLISPLTDPNCPGFKPNEFWYIGGTDVGVVTTIPHDKAAATGWVGAEVVNSGDTNPGVDYPEQATLRMTAPTTLGTPPASGGVPGNNYVYANYRDRTTTETVAMVAANILKKSIAIGTMVARAFYEWVVPGKILTAVEGMVTGVLDFLAAVGVPGAGDAANDVHATLDMPTNCFNCMVQWGLGSVTTPPPTRDPMTPVCTTVLTDVNVAQRAHQAGTAGALFLSYFPGLPQVSPVPTGSANPTAGAVCNSIRGLASAVKGAYSSYTGLTSYFDAANGVSKGPSGTLSTVGTAVGTVIKVGTIGLEAGADLASTTLDYSNANPFGNFTDFMSQCSENYAMPAYLVNAVNSALAPPVSINGTVSAADAGRYLTITATGGTFALVFGTARTTAIPSNATPAQISTAISLVLPAADVTVTGSARNITLAFSADVYGLGAGFSVDTSGLTGGGATVRPIGAANMYVDVVPTGTGGNLAVRTVTSSSGYFSVGGLAAGSYRVEASGPYFDSTWYGGGSESSATVIDLTRATTASIAISMSATPPGAVGGTVTSVAAQAGAPAALVTLYVVDENGTATSVATASTSGAQGEFHFAGVAPGTYRLKVQNADAIARWWDGSLTPPTYAPFDGYALDFTVGAGTSTTLAMQLAPASTVPTASTCAGATCVG